MRRWPGVAKAAAAVVLLSSLEMPAFMPPLKLPFMFSPPIYRINVIADVCHGKVSLRQGLPRFYSLPHSVTG